MTQNAAQVHEAAVIERTLERCSQEQRELVYWRYAEGRTWDDVAARLQVGDARRIRDQVLAILAMALGVWGDG